MKHRAQSINTSILVKMKIKAESYKHLPQLVCSSCQFCLAGTVSCVMVSEDKILLAEREIGDHKIDDSLPGPSQIFIGNIN